MKRLWFAVGVMAVLFTATLLNSRYLRNFSAGLTDRLVQAEVQAEAGNWEEAGRLTKEALDVWTSHDMYLYTVLRHSDTDQIHTGFREVQEFINCQEGGEYSAANARLISQVELLYEMEQFNLKTCCSQSNSPRTIWAGGCFPFLAGLSAELQLHAALRRHSPEQVCGNGSPLLALHTVHVLPGGQLRHHRPDLFQVEETHGCAVKALLPPIVETVQQELKNPNLLVQLRQICRFSDPARPLDVLVPAAARDKGVIRIRLFEAPAGKLPALPAVRHAAVLLAASGDGAGLVALPSAAAGAVPAKVHRTQAAVQPTERKQGMLPHKVLHAYFSSRSRSSSSLKVPMSLNWR